MNAINAVIEYFKNPNIEMLGVLATIFILIAFTQTSTKRIRIINSVGSIMFVVYGLCIHAFSVWLLNGLCIIINMYKLYKEVHDEYRKVKYKSSDPNIPDIAKVKWGNKS